MGLTSPFRRILGNSKTFGAHVADFAMDIGTATSLVSSEGKLGSIKVKNVLSNEIREIPHIRTMIARKPVVLDSLTPSAYKERLKHERDRADANTLIEPDNLERDVHAIGQEAFEKWGRTSNFEVIRAVRRGNVGDPQAYRAVMRHLIRMKYADFKWSFKDYSNRTPRILIGVPRNASKHHLETVRSIIKNDLHAEPFLVWEQIAAAVGAQVRNGDQIEPLPYRDPKACGIIDIGGGTTDIAVLCGGEVLDPFSYEHAGDDLDEAIIAHMRNEHGLDIGYRTAIAIKEELGSAVADGQEDDDVLKHIVRGSSFQTEQPVLAKISRAEIRRCIQPALKRIALDIKKYLTRVRDRGEIHADLKENGFYLAGGTSMLSKIPNFFEREIEALAMSDNDAESTERNVDSNKIPIHMVENATTTVIDGLAKMLEDDKLLELGLAS